MSLKIRLSRGGAKKRPFYRIVIADSRAPRDGRFIEKIGFHNPLVPKDHEDRLRLDEDRARHWLSVGAKPTDRVARFMSERGLVDWKAGQNPQKGEPSEKTKQRAADKVEKQTAAKEAAEEAKKEAETKEVEKPVESADKSADGEA